MKNDPRHSDPRLLIIDALDDPGSGIHDLFFVVRLSTPPKLEYLSRGMQDLFAVDRQKLFASLDNLWPAIHPDDLPAVRAVLDRPDGSKSVTYRLRTPDESWHWIECRFTTRRDVGPDPIIIGVGRDISDWKSTEAELTRLSMTDPLTGLANRRQFELRLDQAILEAVRHKTTGAVAYFDMDDLKAINDRFGHPVGDEALRLVASRLRESVRRSDIVARVGGDEFAVVLLEAPADASVTKVRQLIDEIGRIQLQYEGQSVSLRCSAGLAVIPNDDLTPQEVIALADEALYEAKRGGGGSVVLYGDQKGD